MKSFMSFIKSILRSGNISELDSGYQSKTLAHDTMTSGFLSLAKNRRSIYSLGSKLTLTQNEITEIIKCAVKEAPSAFNSQSSRIVVLFGRDHAILWSITREKLSKIVSPEALESASERIDSFLKAAGTILFFEDQETVKSLQQHYPSYSSNFPEWSEQSSGMAQYAVWLALTEKGIGANIQHYNPIIDDEVHAEWNLPESWTLQAQMNIGAIIKHPGDKDYTDDEQRFIIPTISS